MTTLLPVDSDKNVIPTVRLKNSGAHNVSTSGTSARNSTGFDEDTRVISLYATEPVFLKFGDSSVTATTSDHYFPAGIYYSFSIGGGKVDHYTHVAAIAESTAGTLYISEKE